MDIGPRAGYNGGEVVFSGTLPQLLKDEKSLTADYLTGRRTIAPTPAVRGWSRSITVKEPAKTTCETSTSASRWA